MRTQNFGVEIEMTGITRSTAAKVIAGYFNTTATHIGGCYDSYSVRDNDNRQWKIMRDASLRCTNRSGEQASALYSVEFVTPICNYNDIETIQELVRKLRGAGARVNSSCGMHCHIDASRHTPKTLRNIVNIMASKEDLLYKSLKVNVSREHYCQKMDTRFLDEINNRPPLSMEQLKSMWYDGGDYSYRHYDDSRYHGLNLHSVFSKGTIEFRLFNSTLHAGEVKSAIQLCLAISHQALIQKSARHTKTVSDNEKYTFRTWLLRLGLIGDEFKTARHHLLKNLDGNIAWKDPAQAEKQKERLAQKRLEVLQNSTNENTNLEPEVETAEQQEEASGLAMRMKKFLEGVIFMSKLYVAYGSNLNIKQMAYRCPTATLVGTGVIENYELQFKGMPTGAYATIAPCKGKSVPVAVWDIKPIDEMRLDRYEGYPSHYFKQDIPVKMNNGEELSAMVYIMDLKQKFGLPSSNYYYTVLQGYHDCNLDDSVFKDAVKNSADRFMEEQNSEPNLSDDEGFDMGGMKL